MRRGILIIFIAFCVSFLAVVGLSLFSIERYTTYTSYSDEVARSNKIIRALYKTEVLFKDMDRWERGYILTNDTTYLNGMYKAIDSLGPAVKELQETTGNDKEQQRNIALLRGNIALRLNYARMDVHYIDSSHSRLASSYYFEGRKYMVEANKKLREMHALASERLAAKYTQENIYRHLTSSTLKALILIFCLVTLALFAMLIRLMRARIKYQDALQAKVIDLQRSHSELQEIAYVASHDLQEPLRKIQVFSNMLLFQKAGALDADCTVTLQRINSSANRMQELITDLTSLTNLTKTSESKTKLDLNRVLHYLLIDIREKIDAKQACVQVDDLPQINGYDSQIHILFLALLDNALKFTRIGVVPVITIGCQLATGEELKQINPNLNDKKFYCISCSDNGIGFDNQYISKIFQMFQRLHTQDKYEGKGIGLAICQRIMANHEGYIVADGKPNGGAKFKLFFPIES
jgi:signal transduction histidine kinase